MNCPDMEHIIESKSLRAPLIKFAINIQPRGSHKSKDSNYYSSLTTIQIT